MHRFIVRLNLITHSHLSFLRLFFIVINLSLPLGTALAQSPEPTLFKAPPALTKVQLNQGSDALTLLHSPEFMQALRSMAKRIDAQTLEQQVAFNRVGLLSARGEHRALLAFLSQHRDGMSFSHYRFDSETLLALEQARQGGFKPALTRVFSDAIARMDNQVLYQVDGALGWSVENAQNYVFNVYKRYQGLSELTVEQVISLIVNSHLHSVLERVIPVTRDLLRKENLRRYDIDADILITTPEGIELAATLVKPKGVTKPLPTALQFTIYADQGSHIRTAINAAARGYVGVVANSRGKRASRNTIVPWEHEGEDATQVIDWISKQPWSDGRVLMYGGSYNGFTQWAAAKHMHPALVAMAPSAAANPITGLPYENNVLLTGNYPWAFHVTNNKTMDHSVYADRAKNDQLLLDLFESGRPSTDIDKIDGTPNPWFQKWLRHPEFDRYYEAMIPVREEYANIAIPVLSITGYFDGGQISALDFMNRHYRYNPKANHSLLIGPYNHVTAQWRPSSHHSNYQLDDVALEKDTEQLVFDWFDHLLYQKPKPALLKGKINYQLMGSNQWQHKNSLRELNSEAIPFSLGTSKNEFGYYSLLDAPEEALGYVLQTVDLSDRTTEHNRAPWPVIQERLNEPHGLVFMTEAFEQAFELAGAITGYFSIAINKRDVDIGYNFYAIDPAGRAFHLNNYLSRASYAQDMGQRRLLTPEQKTRIPIVNGRMTAKLLEPGSRLALVLNVNKNRDAQVNMGTGNEVNSESVADAGEPLQIRWFNDSQINIPLKRWRTDALNLERSE